MKGYFNKKWGVIAGTVIVVALGGGVFIHQMQYVNQNNISKKMDKEITAYLDQKEAEYFVYFYDKDFCKTCGDYDKELKNYEKKEGALPVYKATGKEETALAFENDLFVDKRYPVLVHVKDGEEYFRYVGAYPIDSLPLATTKEEVNKVEETPTVQEEVPVPVPTETEAEKPSSETDVKADESSEK